MMSTPTPVPKSIAAVLMREGLKGTAPADETAWWSDVQHSASARIHFNYSSSTPPQNKPLSYRISHHPNLHSIVEMIKLPSTSPSATRKPR